MILEFEEGEINGERCARECIGGHCGVLWSSKGVEEK